MAAQKNGKVRPTKAALQLAAQQVNQLIPGDVQQRANVFDPLWAKKVARRLAEDPIWNAIHFKWRDTQQVGRLNVDAMLQHPAVSAPFDFLAAAIKSHSGSFVPQGRDPTDAQKAKADFLNDQITRLGMSGDPRQGWTRVIDWFVQGLRYGFSLAELVTTEAPWGDKSARFIQAHKLIALPQASLDSGFVPLEEFGQSLRSNPGRRYQCMDMDVYGNINAYVQFNMSGDQDRVVWSGAEKLRILHYIHRGGESSPYGQSLLFAAFFAWSSLYTLERMEEAMLDVGIPFLFISYKTPDGVPSPELHAKVVDAIQTQDAGSRVLVVPNGEAESIAPSNKDFTEHATKKKQELRKYITQSMMVPTSLYSETEDSQSDAKALMANFFKHVCPSFLMEFSDVMTWQFGKRLIDANWSRVAPGDYPVFKFNIMLDEDLKSATAILQQVLPHIDSDKLGEVMEFYMPGGFDPNWIASTHASSVNQKRPLAAADAPPGSAQAKTPSAPPGRPPGTPDDNKSL